MDMRQKSKQAPTTPLHPFASTNKLTPPPPLAAPPAAVLVVTAALCLMLTCATRSTHSSSRTPQRTSCPRRSGGEWCCSYLGWHFTECWGRWSALMLARLYCQPLTYVWHVCVPPPPTVSVATALTTSAIDIPSCVSCVCRHALSPPPLLYPPQPEEG
jgi:hypothetical protein